MPLFVEKIIIRIIKYQNTFRRYERRTDTAPGYQNKLRA